ncbi:unnamed protein product [Paramecium sonneborni]|uniref:Uncharacterized protein n=1 Tax=Paramecium sonneborni TaxID=65129 RepID=A0A8S1R6A3_9CILI|nr:unnamed protein product [Paramecium sonneborni]
MECLLDFRNIDVELNYRNIYFIVEVDAMMSKVLRLGNGLICLRDFIVRNKQLIKVNIKMATKLIDGKPFGFQDLKQVVDAMIMAQRLGNGLIWMTDFIVRNKQLIRVNIKMVTKLVDGMLFGFQDLKCRQIYKNVYSGQQCCYDGWWNTGKESIKIGGGCYDQQGDGIKIGKWIELDDGFYEKKQVTYKGVYKNGIKVGRWNAFWISEFQMLGGGCYDEQGEGIKIGKWIDLDDGFNEKKQVFYKGEYQNGSKVGRWNTILISGIICGGCYDNKGNEIKIGKWIDLDEAFNEQKQVIYDGEYMNGKKVGRWKTYLISARQTGGGCYDEQGGGCYDEQGGKIGKWIDLCDVYQRKQQVFYAGEYKNDKKVGIWEISYWNDQMKNHQYLGGGFYNESGIKIGKWIDLYEVEQDDTFTTYHGNYQNGEKVGVWNVFYGDQEIDKIQYQN